MMMMMMNSAVLHESYNNQTQSNNSSSATTNTAGEVFSQPSEPSPGRLTSTSNFCRNSRLPPTSPNLLATVSSLFSPSPCISGLSPSVSAASLFHSTARRSQWMTGAFIGAFFTSLVFVFIISLYSSVFLLHLNASEYEYPIDPLEAGKRFSNSNSINVAKKGEAAARNLVVSYNEKLEFLELNKKEKNERLLITDHSSSSSLSSSSSSSPSITSSSSSSLSSNFSLSSSLSLIDGGVSKYQQAQQAQQPQQQAPQPQQQARQQAQQPQQQAQQPQQPQQQAQQPQQQPQQQTQQPQQPQQQAQQTHQQAQQTQQAQLTQQAQQQAQQPQEPQQQQSIQHNPSVEVVSGQNRHHHSHHQLFEQAVENSTKVFQSFQPELKMLLEIEYIAAEKELPYVGHPEYIKQFINYTGTSGAGAGAGEKTAGSTAAEEEDEIEQQKKQKLLNSMAVFPSAVSLGFEAGKVLNGMHGILGWTRKGVKLWQESPMPLDYQDPRVNMTEELKTGGGFYSKLSDALPLDRQINETRESFCLNETYNLVDLDDASVIITFYNELYSTLLRSVHSILNRTPPPLLREIVLVDDHSDTADLAQGGLLEQSVRTLPKVKLLRLPQRKGLVMARIAGAKFATAPVIVVLDSHIEVGNAWLEPQLLRLRQSPRSVVVPIIDSINSSNFDYQRDVGIGCWVGFKWSIQEQSTITIPLQNSHPIPSPSMAGGLYAIRADWFWELGGYDEGTKVWGAENIEMGFRVWMCGGRIECTPCSRVFHIFRKNGNGYQVPAEIITRNKLRVARIWMDEYFNIARLFINGAKEAKSGNIDRMLRVKEGLKCKPFKWYLDHVDPLNPVHLKSDIVTLGEIKSVLDKSRCIDTLGSSTTNFGTFYCHGLYGTQGFMLVKDGRFVTLLNDRQCLSGIDNQFKACDSVLKNDGKFVIHPVGSSLNEFMIEWIPVDQQKPSTCLTLKMNEVEVKLVFESCAFSVFRDDDDDSSSNSSTVAVQSAPLATAAAASTTLQQKQQTWFLQLANNTSVSNSNSNSSSSDGHSPRSSNSNSSRGSVKFSTEYLKRRRIAESIAGKTQDEIVWIYGKAADGKQIDQLVLGD